MFRSFFMAGFEGSTGWSHRGHWFDQVAATGHEKTVDADYKAISALGLHAAREAVRWPLVDKGRGVYDFSTLSPFLSAARRHHVEVIWDLFHYGYPDDIDIWSADFPKRFADYCFAVASHLSVRMPGRLAVTPVNEPSYLAHAAGETGKFAPYGMGRGFELKVQLCRAAIAGIEAIWAVSPDVTIVNVDPVCRVTFPKDKPELAAAAEDFNNRLVYQAWDMLSGRLLPELGGSPAHLGVIGMNYYWTNQWELGAACDAEGIFPPLAADDPRRVALGELVRAVHARYGHPLMITETSHSGAERGPWVEAVTREAEALLLEGVPLGGVCLYPILGMPEWHEPETWTPMGLWHPLDEKAPHAGRGVNEPMRAALLAATHLEKLHASGRDKHEAEVLSLRAFASRQRRLKTEAAARLSQLSLARGKP